MENKNIKDLEYILEDEGCYIRYSLEIEMLIFSNHLPICIFTKPDFEVPTLSNWRPYAKDVSKFTKNKFFKEYIDRIFDIILPESKILITINNLAIFEIIDGKIFQNRLCGRGQTRSLIRSKFTK